MAMIPKRPGLHKIRREYKVFQIFCVDCARPLDETIVLE